MVLSSISILRGAAQHESLEVHQHLEAAERHAFHVERHRVLHHLAEQHRPLTIARVTAYQTTLAVEMGFEDFVAAQLSRHQPLGRSLTRVLQKAYPQTVIVLEYPLDARPRWHDQQPNPHLYAAISRHRAKYAECLRSFLEFSDDFRRIPIRSSAVQTPSDPCWINGWLPALDSMALYALVALQNPRHYMEVGSGNSTKFARRAITDHQLQTQITSIDPWPRAEIDDICDRVIRQPVERVTRQRSTSCRRATSCSSTAHTGRS